jgi:hypothetical protein
MEVCIHFKFEVDIFLLMDDSESFAPHAQAVKDMFTSLVSNLPTLFTTADFGFGVGRFEDYGGPGSDFSGGDTGSRPFILNQPIVTSKDAGSQASLEDLIEAALSRDNLAGSGGDLPGSAISEALYQVAVGDGFDGNGDGQTTGNGGTQVAGAEETQTTPDETGDVPAFSSLAGGVIHSGAIGGAGFRQDAKKLVILATDSCPVAAFDSTLDIPSTINGIQTTDLLCTKALGKRRYGFVSDSLTQATNTINGAVVPYGAHTAEEAIGAIYRTGRVIGIGPGAIPRREGSGPSKNEDSFLTALASATEAFFVENMSQTPVPIVIDLDQGVDPVYDAIGDTIYYPWLQQILVSVELESSCELPLTITHTPDAAAGGIKGMTSCFEVAFQLDNTDMTGTCNLDFMNGGESKFGDPIPVYVDCTSST